MKLDELPNMNVDSLNDHITSTILEAAKQSIPRGCRAIYKPFWNENLEKARKAKNEARENLEFGKYLMC